MKPNPNTPGDVPTAVAAAAEAAGAESIACGGAVSLPPAQLNVPAAPIAEARAASSYSELLRLTLPTAASLPVPVDAMDATRAAPAGPVAVATAAAGWDTRAKAEVVLSSEAVPTIGVAAAAADASWPGEEETAEEGGGDDDDRNGDDDNSSGEDDNSSGEDDDGNGDDDNGNGDGGGYVDLSRRPDPRVPPTGQHVTELFPEKLHRLLADAEAEGFEDVIGFFPHGRAFCIFNPDRFMKEVAPRYFSNAQLPSLFRQLNLYGFTHITDGPDVGGYYHERFLRGRPMLSYGMRRVVIKGRGKPGRARKIPDFFSMPPIMTSAEAEAEAARLAEERRKRESEAAEAASAVPAAASATTAHNGTAQTRHGGTNLSLADVLTSDMLRILKERFSASADILSDLLERSPPGNIRAALSIAASNLQQGPLMPQQAAGSQQQQEQVTLAPEVIGALLNMVTTVNQQQAVGNQQQGLLMPQQAAGSQPQQEQVTLTPEVIGALLNTIASGNQQQGVLALQQALGNQQLGALTLTLQPAIGYQQHGALTLQQVAGHQQQGVPTPHQQAALVLTIATTPPAATAAAVVDVRILQPLPAAGANGAPPAVATPQ